MRPPPGQPSSPRPRSRYDACSRVALTNFPLIEPSGLRAHEGERLMSPIESSFHKKPPLFCWFQKSGSKNGLFQRSPTVLSRTDHLVCASNLCEDFASHCAVHAWVAHAARCHSRDFAQEIPFSRCLQSRKPCRQCSKFVEASFYSRQPLTPNWRFERRAKMRTRPSGQPKSSSSTTTKKQSGNFRFKFPRPNGKTLRRSLIAC